MLKNIPGLMDRGSPVRVCFTEEEGEDSPFLFCELVQKARHGESFLIRDQGCSVGAYILGRDEGSPDEYYHTSKRYRDRSAAKRAVAGLHRVAQNKRSLTITPYSGQEFDVLILFLKPERAMRIVQARSYRNGIPVDVKTGGIASVCSECTAYPMLGKLGISLGCKGSRKHSRYSDDELVVGIPFPLAQEIDEALGNIPETNE